MNTWNTYSARVTGLSDQQIKEADRARRELDSALAAEAQARRDAVRARNEARWAAEDAR